METYKEHSRSVRINIQRNLRILREDSGLSQSNVAAVLGKSNTAVASWEQGLSLPDAPTLHYLSEFYGASVDDICAATITDKREDHYA